MVKPGNKLTFVKQRHPTTAGEGVFAWGVFAWVFLRIAWVFLRISS